MAVDKARALQDALAKIEKDFGKGSIMKLGDHQEMHVEAIATGSLALDLALGKGGGVGFDGNASDVHQSTADLLKSFAK